MEFILFILYPLALVRLRLVLIALAFHGTLIVVSAIDYGRIPLITVIAVTWTAWVKRILTYGLFLNTFT